MFKKFFLDDFQKVGQDLSVGVVAVGIVDVVDTFLKVFLFVKKFFTKLSDFVVGDLVVIHLIVGAINLDCFKRGFFRVVLVKRFHLALVFFPRFQCIKKFVNVPDFFVDCKQ